MLHKTRGIVLHKIDFSDSDIIAYVYTEVFGRQSYLVKGAKSKRAKVRISYFQPLSLIELNVSVRPHRSLHQISEIRMMNSNASIYNNLAKRSVAMFLSEVLYRSLKEEENNTELFEFLYNMIVILESEPEASPDFHIYFLVRLTAYLGFVPNNNFSERNCYFNLSEGCFTSINGEGINHIEKSVSEKLSLLLSTEYENIHSLGISKIQRSELLRLLVLYYQLHLISMNEIKSLDVLKEVFTVL